MTEVKSDMPNVSNQMPAVPDLSAQQLAQTTRQIHDLQQLQDGQSAQLERSEQISKDVQEDKKDSAKATQKTGRDQISETARRLIAALSKSPVSDQLEHIRAELLRFLLAWEASGQKSPEENLAELQAILLKLTEALDGQVLLMDPDLESALLDALSSVLEYSAPDLLTLTGASQSDLEQLLDGLFRQLSGTEADQEAVAQEAGQLARTVRQSAGSGPRSAAASPQSPLFTAQSTQQRDRAAPPALEEGGVLYRRASQGVDTDTSYRQIQHRTSAHARPIRPETASLAQSPAGRTAPYVTARDVQLAERFAKVLLTTQPSIPAERLPYTSEERFGLELGLLWLEGETIAGQPGISPAMASILNKSMDAYLKEALTAIGRNFSHAARRHPPDVCPDLRLEDIARVQQEFVRRYRATGNAERTVLEVIRFAMERFEKKQEDYTAVWLRYGPGMGLFTPRKDKEDLKIGWLHFCRSWSRFLKESGLSGKEDFSTAAGLQSLWAMLFPGQLDTSFLRRSPASVGGWLAACASAGTTAYGLWYAQGGMVRPACLGAGVIFGIASVLFFRRKRIQEQGG